MSLIVCIVYYTGAAALFFACFCRAAHTSKGNTRRVIRLAFTALGISALAAIFAPWAWGYRPDLLTALVLAASAAVQLATAHYWRQGLPRQFQLPGLR